MVPKDIQEEVEKFAKVSSTSCVVGSPIVGELGASVQCSTSLIGAHHLIDNLIPRLDG